MRFLIDEMFGAQVAVNLTKAGHDGLHVTDVELVSASDARLLAWAVADDRVLVTENAVDFMPLLSQREAAGLALAPVVIADKRSLPRRGGRAIHGALADRLVRWAENNPEPYRHVHWLP